jgi:hypothetical protein
MNFRRETRAGWKFQPLNRACGRASVPKGHLGIARRFNAGFGHAEGQVPKGRPKRALVFSRPFGTGFVCGLIPALKQISRRGS